MLYEVITLCDVAGCGQSADCNDNGIPDECDVLAPIEAMLTAADASPYDHFGSSVAVSGDTVVVGA